MKKIPLYILYTTHVKNATISGARTKIEGYGRRASVTRLRGSFYQKALYKRSEKGYNKRESMDTGRKSK